MHHLHFNHIAILVSALIQWFLGALWYSPLLFAKPWSAMAGVSRGTAKKNAMILGMIASFIGSLFLSFILAHVVYWAGAWTLQRGAFVGFIVWAGFIVSPLAASYIYEGRPFKLFAINTGYWLLALVISGGLLAVWR
jgi:hypothetical protein